MTRNAFTFVSCKTHLPLHFDDAIPSKCTIWRIKAWAIGFDKVNCVLCYFIRIVGSNVITHGRLGGTTRCIMVYLDKRIINISRLGTFRFTMCDLALYRMTTDGFQRTERISRTNGWDTHCRVIVHYRRGILVGGGCWVAIAPSALLPKHFILITY